MSAKTTDRSLILRATADPDAAAQASVASALAKLGVAPAIHTVDTTEAGTWMVMDQVTPGTTLAETDPRTLNLDDLTAPLRSMVGEPAPSCDLPSITDWLRDRLTDDHLADIPPGQTRSDAKDRKHALDLLNELADDTRTGLCHGDTSTFNVVADADGRWMFIDPRGMRGEVEYDAAVMAFKIADALTISEAVARVADAVQLDYSRVQKWVMISRSARV
ncbi:aminoglycoside phosphotransferase family protein [Amycolatopsis sp. NBC_00345]|uniref:aminoglycoside phosphotransferase family protein n=1 Tax=Amycolatopsis sp. NBC_00345 TaxID=2975955 RepID=UPI002E268291